jgi:hypothetical protein
MIGLLLFATLPFLAACGGDDDTRTENPSATASQSAAASTTNGPSAPSATSPAPSPTLGGSTPSVTPQPSLDPIVRALQARDWAAIQPLLEERMEPCVTPFTAASAAPPCPGGSPQGTLVEVFPAAGCHSFMSAEELEGQFTAAGPAPKLYAIYRSSAQHPRVPRLPAGELGIILDRGALGGQLFTVSGARIVSADFGCAIPPKDIAALVPSSSFLVAPPGP